MLGEGGWSACFFAIGVNITPKIISVGPLAYLDNHVWQFPRKLESCLPFLASGWSSKRLCRNSCTESLRARTTMARLSVLAFGPTLVQPSDVELRALA